MNYSMLQAINKALDFALANDDKIILLGQDIAENGGVFRATDNLAQKFGKQRVINTPISETLMTGMATGLAIAGFKPIVEFQFSGFMLSAVEQLAIHASRMRSRTRGAITCPMVLRAAYGAGIGAPEHHSESPEALFAHIPGIKVVIPAEANHAHGLLLAAINDPDPVVFLEPKKLYHSQKQELNIGQHIELNQSFITQTGFDITLIGWGAMLPIIKSASNECANVSCEIINLSCIYPLDIDKICASIRKTGRVVIVHEACRSFGAGAEILALIAELCTPYLLAPPKRITGHDIPTPYFKREQEYLPKISEIVNTINQLMEY